jgi:hypothetical protein
MMPRNAGMVQGDAATITRRVLGHLTYLRYGVALAPGEQRTDRRIFTATCAQVQPREVVAMLAHAGAGRLRLRKLVYIPARCPPHDWLAWTRREMAALPSPTPLLCWFAVRSQQPIPQVRVVVVERLGALAPVIPLAEVRAARQHEQRAGSCLPLERIGQQEGSQ